MALFATDAATSLDQIQSITSRAVFGGAIFILLSLVMLNLFSRAGRIREYVFVVLIAAVALVSGVLVSAALYVIANPLILTLWKFSA